jgi:hypothetical protein
VRPVSGVLLRGCLTEKIGLTEKIAGKNRRTLSHEDTRGDLPLTEGSFRQRGRNLDIRLGSCEGITDP